MSRGSAGEVPLERSGRPVGTVFDLLGRDENHLTAALGWALSQSPVLLGLLARSVFDDDPGEPLRVQLQHAGEDRGYTDVEIDWRSARLIAEAKRGWNLPDQAQLRRYRPRLDGIDRAVLLTLSECSAVFARTHLPPEIDGVAVRHQSWPAVLVHVEEAARCTRGREQRMLRDFETYLRGVIRVQNLFSNWVYCVSIGDGRFSGGSLSFRDVIDRRRYFHPFGVSGWPTTPPNYIAFRWRGHVQRIHHVDDYRVIDDLQQDFPEIAPTPATTRQHFLYELGPIIGPSVPLPSGAQYRAGRHWVALDLLLTAATLKDALEGTRERRARKAAEPE